MVLPYLNLLSYEIGKWEASAMAAGAHSPSVCEIEYCRGSRIRKT